MSIDIMIFGGFGIFIIILFLVIYFKDQESNRKFERFERAIEDLNHQNHQLKQLLNEQSQKGSDNDNLDIATKIQEEINIQVAPLLQSVKDIEEVMAYFKNDQQERISKLEQRAKIMNMPNNPATSNEKLVIQHYNEGKRVADIARDLRIGLGEVEFILKMHNLL